MLSAVECCGMRGVEVADHPPVDDVGEVAFEDPHCFFLGVAAAAGVVIDLLGSRFAAPLGDRHQVQYGVDPTVPAPG